MRILFVACSFGPFAIRNANAQLPGDRTIEFHIHETPSDPESAVVFVVALDITAIVASAEEDSIAWDISLATFTDCDSGGDVAWTVEDPEMDTPDNMWWVDHANITKPVISEFVVPPLIEGTADPDDPQNEELEYEFEGVAYDPPGEPPYETTAFMTGVMRNLLILLLYIEEEPTEIPGY